MGNYFLDIHMYRIHHEIIIIPLLLGPLYCVDYDTGHNIMISDHALEFRRGRLLSRTNRVMAIQQSEVNKYRSVLRCFSNRQKAHGFCPLSDHIMLSVIFKSCISHLCMQNSMDY